MDLYYEIDSQSCLSVIITAAALNVKLNLKEMSLMVKKNHLTPEYTKINPQQTIPTLVDNGFALAESRAINAYLVEKYGKDDSLYPKDVKTRALVNQRMFFDIGTLETHMLNYFLHWFWGKPQDPQDLKRFEKALVTLNTFLEGNNYIAGTKSFTIADISTYTTFLAMPNIKYDFSPYPNVKKWLKLMEEKLPAKESIDKTVKGMYAFNEKYGPKA